ncbi:GIY-YIG nuclease family protein [Phenylobacterium sp.]|uniref:GIY-YIG nuclease family protein n=1 Tax=Phenylobacterium sp. TaxID=1871053 RepID=UPI0025E65D26|nr:GIY-YIG nuclease family protein [Phenylobacterium sp.]MBX3483348.1 GIY-YIG nuclease family protein [Phenylobacterium sp.]
MQDNTYWVYILASDKLGTLYVGVTNSLERRIAEHRSKEAPGFTKTYAVDRLVFFRGFGDVAEAIHFEKQLKRWRRDWKIRLIETENPHWADLYLDMMALPPLHPDLAAAGVTR